MKLAGHFKADDLRNPTEVLTSFDLHPITGGDGDVQVLPYASQSTPDAPGTPQNSAKSDGCFLSMIWGFDVRSGGDFDEREAETVEVVHHLLTVVQVERVKFSSAVLLKTDDVDANGPFFCLKHPVCCHQ